MKSYIGCAYVITRSDVWLRSPGVWRDDPQTKIGAGTSDVFGGSLTSQPRRLIVEPLDQMYQHSHKKFVLSDGSESTEFSKEYRN